MPILMAGRVELRTAQDRGECRARRQGQTIRSDTWGGDPIRPRSSGVDRKPRPGAASHRTEEKPAPVSVASPGPKIDVRTGIGEVSFGPVPGVTDVGLGLAPTGGPDVRRDGRWGVQVSSTSAEGRLDRRIQPLSIDIVEMNRKHLQSGTRHRSALSKIAGIAGASSAGRPSTGSGNIPARPPGG